MPASTIGVIEYPRKCDFTQGRWLIFGRYSGSSPISSRARPAWLQPVQEDSSRLESLRRAARAERSRAAFA